MTMRIWCFSTVSAVLGAIAAVTVAGQQPAPLQQTYPSPGCTATSAQLEANRKVAMEFWRVTGEARVALAAPTYKQHNPQSVKRAQENKVSDYEQFRSDFLPGGFFDRAAARGAGSAGPQPPASNPVEIVTAECDIVTMIRKSYRQDPTAAPGTFYEVFSFDTFRVTNGKLTEHWDGNVINPPPVPTDGRGR
jgi:predicted SnoaL-like aldol condensation-catalyzing enzyme